MTNALVLIFFISVLLILHTYVLYPLLMLYRSRKNNSEFAPYTQTDSLPKVAVLIAAYNEESVIYQKLVSVFETNYPLEKLKVYVGSDASEDKTEALVNDLKLKYPKLELIHFKERVGKINIVNHLQSLVEEDILIMTDANVVFTPQTLFELVKFFNNERVGIVASNIIKQSTNNEGIAYQEKMYLSLENKIKHSESTIFGKIMGAEGGCYAIRNSLFSKVPSRFIVDDFFITLQVILKGYFTLFNEKAICHEDVSVDIVGEFKRKVRISSGNFQNLFFFKSCLIRFWEPLGFMFWSHKVLRWLTPFFLLIAFVSSFLLALNSQVFFVLTVLQAFGFMFPLFHQVLKFNSAILKFITHFYFMNLALLFGFIKFVRGIKTSIWQPVKRNV